MKPGNRLKRTVIASVLVWSSLPTSIGSQRSDCASPTGRNPKLSWTPAQQCVWNRMRSDNHPWFRLVVDNAAIERYSDYGRWAMLAYQMTGDRKYGRLAYERFKRDYTNFNPAGITKLATYAAWHMVEQLQLTDWTSPVLSKEEHAELRDVWTRVADHVIARNRLADSDATIGHYFGLAFMDQLFGTAYLARTTLDPGTGRTVALGGLSATGANFDTVRNTVAKYVEMADGGTWLESSDYNSGTLQFLNAAYGIQTATGVDYFPEITRLRAQVIRQQMHELTPDMKDSFQWGDEQHPYDLRIGVHRGDLWMSYAHLPGPPAALQAEFRQWIDDAFNANGVEYRAGGDPLFARHLYYSNPYAPKAPWKDSAVPFLNSPGMGHVYVRSGWSPSDSALHAYFISHKGAWVDHFPLAHGNFRWWANGKWLINHPIAYAGLEPRLLNQVLVMNSGPSNEAGGLTASGFRAGEVMYAAGTNAGYGPDVPENASGPPPVYLHESTRSIVNLLDRGILVVFDRVHAEDVRTQVLPNGGSAITRYYPNVQERIKSSLGVIDWLMHTPVRPDIGKQQFTWPVADTRVTVHNVSPPVRYTVVDERQPQTPPLRGTIADQVKQFAVHVLPIEVKEFQTFATVISTSDSTVSSESVVFGSLEGVKLIGSGLTDTYVLFSAVPGPKLAPATTTNRSGGILTAYDPAKLQAVVNSRLISELPTLPISPDARIYLADVGPSVSQIAINGRVQPLERIGDLVASGVRAAPNRVSAPPQPGQLRVIKK